MGSLSTRTSGYAAASCPAMLQWVVTRLPDRSPAAASTNVPVHSPTTRRDRAAFCRSQRTTSALTGATSAPLYGPGTSTVCGATVFSRTASGTRVRPLGLRTGVPPGLAVRMRYGGLCPPAPWRTRSPRTAVPAD